MKLAVIPARGGSKRIPRKNIREFCGRPMIAWAIEAARESGLSPRAFAIYWVLRDDTALQGAGIDAMALAKEAE